MLPSASVYPTRLRDGSCIGVFSPSEPITPERRKRLDEGLRILKSNGFNTRLSTHALDSKTYMAGEVKDRASDIVELAVLPEVHALMASWGGKSCSQLLPHLDFKALSDSRKPILGFSDGCVPLNAITSITGLITFHGPNIVGKLTETKHANLRILVDDFYEKRVNLLGETRAVGAKVLRPGIARGRLFGGNLSTFVLGLLGSSFMPSLDGVLLFWESAYEPVQIVDQFLTCLRNAGAFDRLAGMVIGDFFTAEQGYKARDPFELLRDIVGDFDFPVLYCPTFGHPAHLENPILPIGAACELNASAMSLDLLEPVTEEV